MCFFVEYFPSLQLRSMEIKVIRFYIIGSRDLVNEMNLISSSFVFFKPLEQGVTI